MAHQINARLTSLQPRQLWETVVSKLNALSGGGYARFGVPFTGMDRLVTTCSGLHAAGFHSMGREQLYSTPCAAAVSRRVAAHEVTGITGEPLDGPSFIGCVFYQRLRHMLFTRIALARRLCQREPCERTVIDKTRHPFAKKTDVALQCTHAVWDR